MSVWMVETLIATSLLMALVMMLRRPVARWLGAGAAYWLWALPFARMLLPALPAPAQSPLHQAVDQAGLPALLTPMTPPVMASMPTHAVAPPFPWLELVVTLWLAGAAIFLSVHIVGYARFRRHLLRGVTEVGEEGRIRIVTSPQATGPLAFGVLRPYIVLPVDFGLRFDAQEQMMALAHERAHHERGDLVANLIALGLLALHWCNPIAWFAYRAYRADQEQACDARVLGLYGQDHAQAYGRAILKAAGGRQFAGACHLTRLQTLKGRLSMLSAHEISLRRISWSMAAVALVTLSGLALTASGSRAARQMAAITDKVQDIRLARLTDLIAEPAAASTGHGSRTAEPPAVPATPDAVDVAAAPAAPAPPPAPAIEAAPPVPPLPPVPPVAVRSEGNRVIVTHADGRREAHRIPTAAEIRRMTPDVDVAEGCDDAGSMTTSSESIGADGRKKIRVRLCNARIERMAEMQARQADQQARKADRQARLAEVDAARIDRQARVAALSGLRAARVQIARLSMPDEARADALRDIDKDIADMEAGRD
jgi:beta-lactamase regulating signal transducer with metallopeptidase domain